MSIASNAGQAGSMGMGAAAPASAERTASAYAKVTRRIVPFIVLATSSATWIASTSVSPSCRCSRRWA